MRAAGLAVPGLWGLVLWGLCGCGPGVKQLVADKHYREAICAGQQGSKATRALVAQALWEDLGLHLHAHAVTEAELAQVVGDEAGRISARARFVRLRLHTNVLPVDRLELSAAVKGGEGGSAVTWEALSWATGEPLPPPVEYDTYLTARNVLRTLAAIPTLGVVLAFSPYQAERRVGEAPFEVYQRTAPLAAGLHRQMVFHGCRELAPPASGKVGKECTGFFVLDPAADSALSLQISVAWDSQRIEGQRGPEEQRCTATRTVAIPLGTAAGLPAQLERQFGPRMRRWSELQGR